MSNQPIEEKWKEEFREKFVHEGIFTGVKWIDAGLDGSRYRIEDLESFIENLLEQEKRRIEKELVRLPVYYSEETPNTLVSLSSVISIINK